MSSGGSDWPYGPGTGQNGPYADDGQHPPAWPARDWPARDLPVSDWPSQPGWPAPAQHQQDQYQQDQYQQGQYQQGQYQQGQYEHDRYQQGQYEQHQGGYEYWEPAPGPGDGYGQPAPSQSWNGGPGHDQHGHSQDGYGQDGYGQNGYGQDRYGQSPAPYRHDDFGPGGYSLDPEPSSYGRDLYSSDRGPASRPEPDPPEGADSGWFSRPDSGSLSEPDTGSFSLPDTGSFRQPDTGSFGQPAGYGREDQPDPYEPPAGGFRRLELPEPTASQAGGDSRGFDARSPRPNGYEPWHDAEDADADSWHRDEPGEADEDWPDEADSGLLSRRFGGDADGSGGSGRRRSKRSRRPRRARGKVAFTAALLAVALILGVAADYGYERYQAWNTSRTGDYTGTGAGSGQVQVLVPEGANLASLGPALVKAGVIMEVRPFDSAAGAAANASDLQPGVYLLNHHMSAADAVKFLLSPAHRIKDQVTIIEGTRAAQIATELAKQTHLPVSQFTSIINHPPASLGLPTWAAGSSAEGFLFPDTYTLLPKMTALQILQMMVREFNQKIASINLPAAATHVFTTPWHALIVASLIQAEGGNLQDFPKISRVVWNRLGKQMPLEFDSTIFYAMGKFGTHVNSAQEKFPSPYNTYLHTGLPPGPIGNPGLAAMKAAVHAAKGDYLYFITDTRKKPYLTYFTASLSQLQQWQQEFGN